MRRLLSAIICVELIGIALLCSRPGPRHAPGTVLAQSSGCTGTSSSQSQTNVSSTFAELAGVTVMQVTSSGRNWNSYQAVPNFSTITGRFVSNNQPSSNNILIQNEDGTNAQTINGSTQGVWVVMDQTGNFAIYQGLNSDNTLDLYQTKISASGSCTQTNLTNLHLTFVSPTNAVLYSNSQADPSNLGHQTYIWSEGGTLRTVDDDGTNIQAITLGDSENAQVFHRMRANPVFPHKLWYKRDAPNPNPNGTATPEIWVADWTNPSTVYNMAIVGGAGVPADHNCWSPDGTEIGFIYNGKWYVQKVLTSTGAFVNGGSYGNATLIGPTNSESVDYAAWFPDMSQFMVTRGTLAPPNFGGEIFEMSLSGHTTGLALTMSSGSNDNSIPKPVMLDQTHAMFTSDAAVTGTPQEYIVTGFPQVSILPAAPQFLMAEVARLMKPLLPESWSHKRAA